MPSPLPTLQASAGVLGAWEAAEFEWQGPAEAACLTPWQGGRPWLQPTKVSAFLVGGVCRVFQQALVGEVLLHVGPALAECVGVCVWM